VLDALGEGDKLTPGRRKSGISALGLDITSGADRGYLNENVKLLLRVAVAGVPKDGSAICAGMKVELFGVI
jgi:hypothetical protein